ncbi:MAG: helix-turn-helix domain-containing protein [Candidatus Nanoarchaeia archaeon]
MIKELLGIRKLQRRVSHLGLRLKKQEEKFEARLSDVEGKLKKLERHESNNEFDEVTETEERDMQWIIKQLKKKPMTTTELAEKIQKHRTWLSHLLNRLQNENKVKEFKRRGREIVYGLRKGK